MKETIIELTNETFRNYEDLNRSYIQFFMYAEGGAMGEAGAVNAITKKNDVVNVYHANYAFGDFDKNNISIIFPCMQYYRHKKKENDTNDPNGFCHRYLGVGNHLFIRNCYRQAFDERFEFADSAGEVFQGWFETAMDLLYNRKPDWKYCVVGNIVDTRIDDSGIFRHGTVQFSGGTRVYLCGKNWSDDCGDTITVIGHKRRGGYAAEEVPIRAIQNVRCSRVYKPSVLELMNYFEFCNRWWHNTPEDKKDIERFVREWKEAERKRKPYNYSVGNVLTAYFGEDTVSAMRASKQESFESDIFKNHIVPLMWQYADRCASELYLSDCFLIETVVGQDYIAYLTRKGKKKIVHLMLLAPPDGSDLIIDADYADAITSAWEVECDKAYLLVCHVSVEFSKANRESFSFKSHRSKDMPFGIALLTVKTVNDRKILVRSAEECWDYYERKAISVWRRGDIREYECLFSPDVEIITEEDNEKKVICRGIPALMTFFAENAPLKIVYEEYNHSRSFTQVLYADEKPLTITVQCDNLIVGISIGKKEYIRGETITDKNQDPYGSLIDRVPAVRSMGILDIKKMHAFAVQLSYADDNIRNYYLHPFNTISVPEHFELDGYVFDLNVIASARIIEGDLVFSNGYRVPKHILYYRSYRQVNIEKRKEAVYRSESVEVISLYRTPLKHFSGHFIVDQYTGFDEDCFGPKEAWLDKNGNKASDIALLSIHVETVGDARSVCVEPTLKYGLLHPDGTWLFPPIYDSFGEQFSAGIVAMRSENQYILNLDGNEILLMESIDEDRLHGDRCPFNIAKEPLQTPDLRFCNFFDWDFNQTPGKWGFMDSHGNIVVEPQYLFVLGFWFFDDTRCFVAKETDGKIRWGLIDLDGNEVIPCVYPDLYSNWNDEVLFFKTEDNNEYGPYGVMDCQGNVLMEPKFAFIGDYNAKYNVITVGKNEDEIGVYSLNTGKMIVPMEFDCIDFYDHMIACEIPFSVTDKYFDYDGNELDFGDFVSVTEKNGLLCVQKDEKYGMIDWQGNVVIPLIMDDGFDETIDLFKRGRIISSNGSFHGLKSVAGEVLIPEIYDDIRIYGDFVVASEKTHTNWDLRDTLFDLNGNVILNKPCRNIRFDSEKESFTAETPKGIEFFRYHIR